MLNLKAVEELAERISSVLPADARVLREEFRGNVRALLEATFARMDLVTREEFDAQTAVLRRTREKLEGLEQRLEELESPQR